MSKLLIFVYPFPDVAASMDLLYIIQYYATFVLMTIVQTLAPIQSSTSVSQYHFGLPLFLWHFTFPSSINLFNVWFRVGLHIRNNLFSLFNKVQACSRFDCELIGCGLACSVFSPRYVHYFPIAYISKCIYAFLSVFLCRANISHPYVAV